MTASLIEVDEGTLTGSRSLPDSWREVALGDLCNRYIETRDPRLEPEKEFIYIDITSVDNVSKRIVEPKTLLGKDAPSRARQVIHTGDVLVATTRPNLNAVAIVPPSLNGQICSTGFCVLRSKDSLNNNYLFAYVRGREFVSSLSELVKGALYPAVTDGQVRQQIIPVPSSIAEQERIAAILSEQIAVVERARAAAEAQLEAAKALPVAYLRAVFDSLEAQQWSKTHLGDVLILRKEIIHPRNNPKGAAIFVGLEHIKSGTGERIGSLKLEMSELTGRKPKFYKGDIVYGYLRPYLNKVWLAEFDGLCSVDQYVYTVVPDKADVDFIAWFMRSPIYLNRAPIDLTPGQLPRIRTEEVATVELKLPPIDEQRRIAEYINEKMTSVKQMYKALHEQLNAINKMPAALLNQAFIGKL
jgi:type I restriction enzyme S subunit